MALPATAAGSIAGGGTTARDALRAPQTPPASTQPELVQRPPRAALPRREPRFAQRAARFSQRRARFANRKNGSGGGVQYRIDRSTMILMVCIAGLFDLGQLASKVLYLVGLTLVGAAAGGAVAGETGAAIGAAGGAVATALGFGIGINIMLAEALSWSLMLVGFFSMWLWFQLRGVPVLGGSHMTTKFTVMTLSFVVEFIPILNTVPSITWWTWRMATLSRMEDRKTSNEKGASRATEEQRQEYTQDNVEPSYAYAA